ncbi:hypothetical protein DAPPUDRAFT_257892 [Daphnia pulex]|uniref:Uncharacterized protein n=1 Tax=Daphnia pulex TaxID=6669 RepID=E9HED8_DAPPU|nr:hypothetical protein DAPPUDRAFT_257892 [Daphnia pulex]|eukprot:EFX69917.1 hypothetical protein DAPPUDRAFT_257892 [Daphnia pulex]
MFAKIEPNKNGNLVDSSVSTMRTTQKCNEIKTGLQEEVLAIASEKERVSE